MAAILSRGRGVNSPFTPTVLLPISTLVLGLDLNISARLDDVTDADARFLRPFALLAVSLNPADRRVDGWNSEEDVLKQLRV